MEQSNKRKQGKGIVFSDLVYVKGLTKRLDKNGREYQTFYFIIGQDMGFMSCSYYGDIQLRDGMCLKLLKGRFCPRKTQQNVTYMNFRVEGFEIWQPQPVNEYEDDGLGFDNQPVQQPKEEDHSLDWIQEDEQENKSDDELIDVNEAF